MRFGWLKRRRAAATQDDLPWSSGRPAPRDGESRLLVYRVTGSCGCWCCTGEGEIAPTCCHGYRLLPLSDFGRERRGAVARFMVESDAVAATVSEGGLTEGLVYRESSL